MKSLSFPKIMFWTTIVSVLLDEHILHMDNKEVCLMAIAGFMCAIAWQLIFERKTL